MALTDRLSVPDLLRLPHLPGIPGLPNLPALPRPHYRVSHVKDIPVVMPDGVKLLTDRYVRLAAVL